MRKSQILLFIAFLILFIAPRFAFTQGFKAGPLLGLNACQVDGDSMAGFNQTGIVLGAFVNHHLFKNLDWQLEIKYSVKGAKATKISVEPTFPFYYKSALHYICLPVILSYKIKKWPVSIEAGLETGYLFKVVLWDEYGKLDPDYGSAYNDFDFSALFGVKVNVYKQFYLNLRYLYSIVPFYKDPLLQNNWFYRKNGLFNNDLSFGIYYQFE